MNDKKNLPGMREYDIFTGERIEINELVTKLARHMADTGVASKKKMSYSISSLAQALIKNVAQETGATQGSIVEIAPLLFAKIAMDSLERRANALGSLKTLQDQMDRSLDAFAGLAPHLKAYTDRIKDMVKALVAMEKAAVDAKNFQGVDETDYPVLAPLKAEKKTPVPYNREVSEFLKENKRLAELFKQQQT